LYVFTFTQLAITITTNYTHVPVNTGASEDGASIVREIGDGRLMRVPADFATML